MVDNVNQNTRKRVYKCIEIREQAIMLAVKNNQRQRGDVSKLPDEEIVSWMTAVAEKRDRRAFEQLYVHYAPKIKSYMARQGADPATADDLAQETMVQLWRKAEQYDSSRASPSAWIYRVARNLRIDKLRRQKLHEVELTAEADKVDERFGGTDNAAARIDAGRLRNCIKTLTPDQMAVVQLAFFEGLSHSEVGQRLAIPLGTVKSRLRLAFGKLRAAMGEQI